MLNTAMISMAVPAKLRRQFWPWNWDRVGRKGLGGAVPGLFVAATLLPLVSEAVLAATALAGWEPMVPFVAASLGNWAAGCHLCAGPLGSRNAWPGGWRPEKGGWVGGTGCTLGTLAGPIPAGRAGGDLNRPVAGAVPVSWRPWPLLMGLRRRAMRWCSGVEPGVSRPRGLTIR